MSAARLMIGKGMGRRVTKAGAAAERAFDALVIAHLESIGATPPPKGDVMGRWTVQTIHGALRVAPHGNWIAQVFLDWPKDFQECIAHARARGFDHWKWNFHYELTAEPNVDDWKRALAEILPAAAPVDYRAKYEAEVAHHAETVRQIEKVLDDHIKQARGASREVLTRFRTDYRRRAG